MKYKIFLLVLIFSLACFTKGNAQEDFVVNARRMIDEGKYAPAIELLGNNWRKAINKLEVDLLISVCYCNIGQFEDGVSQFKSIKERYSNLNAYTKNYIESSIARCKPGISIPNKPEQVVSAAASITWNSGKDFKTLIYSPDDFEKEEINNKYTSTIEGAKEDFFKIEKLSERLKKEFTEEEAKQVINTLVSLPEFKNYSISISPNFVVFNFVSNDKLKSREIADELERNLQFYTNAFNMPAPPFKISCYIVGNGISLNKLALHQHGFPLKNNNIGYSVTNDLSISSLAPNQTTGTLNHELIHILVNYNYPYLKPWLNEGLASLYEDNDYKAGKVLGLPNWRGEVISGSFSFDTDGESLSSDFKSVFGGDYLIQLLNKSSDDFNQETLINHALAKYFCLYLQEQQLLVPLFREYHDIFFPDGISENPERAILISTLDIEIISKISGKSIELIQQDFDRWLRKAVTKVEIKQN